MSKTFSPAESNIQRSSFSQSHGSRFYVSPGLALELSDLFALKKRSCVYSTPPIFEKRLSLMRMVYPSGGHISSSFLEDSGQTLPPAPKARDASSMTSTLPLSLRLLQSLYDPTID
ncbi:hypothetical protein CDAR_259231 [Caerostris darwini]|uniref:Uncharacterized protein n=1 Tax=Caerostris darwini TaxID=1538125 RepID=A0AAV4MB36_9ARAC|nr:hypothetical protein CDAR_259231 [Caerostris darwini]